MSILSHIFILYNKDIVKLIYNIIIVLFLVFYFSDFLFC